MIKLENLSLIYPEKLIFENINLNIEKGEIVSVIGPSGSGKATLLKVLASLVKPTSGYAFIAGTEISQENSKGSGHTRNVGYVSEDISLFASKTLIENLMLAQVHVLHRSRQEAYEKSIDMMKACGLAQYAFCYPHELTTGQKKRSLLARELVMDPEVILLHSPVADLDAVQKRQAEFLIKHMADDFGCTVLLTSDDITFVKSVSDRVVFMDAGHIIATGSVFELFEQSDNDKIKNFVSVFDRQETTITSRNFDFVEMNASIERFVADRMLAPKNSLRMRAVFEELAVQMIIPEMDDDFKLKMIMEYIKETKSVRMIFEYTGKEFNPFENADDMSMAIIKNSTESFEYLGGNRISLEIRNK